MCRIAVISLVVLVLSLSGIDQAHGQKIRNPNHGKFRIVNQTDDTIVVGLFAVYTENGRGVTRFWGYREIVSGRSTDFGYSEFHCRTGGEGKLHRFYLYSTAKINYNRNRDMNIGSSKVPWPPNSFDRTLQNDYVANSLMRYENWKPIQSNWPQAKWGEYSHAYVISPQRSGKGASLFIKKGGGWGSLVHN